MHGDDVVVGSGGDDGELPLVLHAGEQERARTGEAEAVLPSHGPAGPLARDGLRRVGLAERADRHETTAFRDGVCPHAAPPTAELIERGLDAGVVDGGAPTLQREAPGELDRDEAAVAVHDVGGDPGAGVCVVDGVELVAACDAGAARVLAGVEGSGCLVVCEGGSCGCT